MRDFIKVGNPVYITEPAREELDLPEDITFQIFSITTGVFPVILKSKQMPIDWEQHFKESEIVEIESNEEIEYKIREHDLRLEKD